MRKRWIGLRLGLAVVACCGGCGSNEEFDHVSVSGKVAFGGKPMTGGTILFVPLVAGAAAQGTITDGAYAIPRPQGPGRGSYRVEISKSAPTGRRIPDSDNPGATIEETRNIVADRYNLNSILKVEIKPEDGQTFDFVVEPGK